MIRFAPRRLVTPCLAGALALALAALLAGPASAQPKPTITNEAEFLGYDAEAKTVEVKITGPGKGKDKDLRKVFRSGQKATFNVKPEGPVISATIVKINGKREDIEALPVGKTINIRWREGAKEGEYFATGIDAILSEDEMDERYGSE